ncbi:MAG: TonB family protein [Woeseiaceae bacterium]
MPRDEFKTQVLLLHSEQNTLDNLCSGFSENYTVHCATSGSEALNTLVETPINVIVSAHDLPGMSGLEALREAKKRSPDTIGILLAESADDGLEALVGDKEVFQVVRGNVTSDSILKLVDNATQQLRLMALAESANDTAANVDEPAEEHIVMETSDNGSTIISDGTGRTPALDPATLSGITSVNSQTVDLLVLTKDQAFLSTIKDSARGMHTVHYANTLAQSIDVIRKHKVGVAVVDAAMVGEKVEQLTQLLRKESSRLVSVVAGRRDDGEMLMGLINRGRVYRFLMKPVSPGRARLAVEASVKHHLEAPDAAFESKDGTTGPLPVLKPTPKPEAKSATDTKPKAKAKAKAKAAENAAPSSASQSDVKADRRHSMPAAPTGKLPVDDELESAFGKDGSSLKETVTGLFSTAGRKLTADGKTDKTSGSDESAESEATPAAAGSSGSPLKSPKMIGFAVVALIGIAGTSFWFMSDPDDAVTIQQPITSTPAGIKDAPSNTTPDDVLEVPSTETAGIDVSALAEEARLARDAGQIFNPLGSNALELYVAAVSADPGNDRVVAELDAVIEQALAMAETALLESRLDDADAALQRVSLADPDNARLPFLTAQLSQFQLRKFLGDARTAIRETRFEDATSALASARSLGSADNTEIDAVENELAAARSNQQVEDVLSMANARLDNGDLLSPPNDNARYYFELALSDDPENTAASQGLSVIASKLALEARSEIDDGNFDSAQGLIDEAITLDPSNNEATAAVSALATRRDEIAAELRRAEEQQRAAAEQKAAEERAEAERQAAEQLAAEERAAAEAAAAEEAAVAAEVAPPEVDADEAASTGATTADSQSPDAAADTLDDEPVAKEAAPVEDKAKAEVAAETTNLALAAISALNRTKYVAPKYPRSAERRNVSGWVDIVFTVAMNGSVKDIEVRNSEPGETFVNAATKAVEKWEFEPIVENGKLVEKRAGVRMMFALE